MIDSKQADREKFFQYVQSYIEKDPVAAAHITGPLIDGLSNALDESNQRAADMEVALAVSTAPRYKGKDEIIKEKLKKWEGKTSLNWRWVTDDKAGEQR